MFLSSLFGRRRTSRKALQSRIQRQKTLQSLRRAHFEPLERRDVMAAIFASAEVVGEQDTGFEARAQIQVAYDGAMDDTLDVSYVVEGTATPGVDHTLQSSGSMHIEPGEFYAYIPYYSIDDLHPEEPFESIYIRITGYTSALGRQYDIWDPDIGQVGSDEVAPPNPDPTVPGCDPCSTSPDKTNVSSNGGAGFVGPLSSGGPSGTTNYPVRYGDGIAIVSSTDLASNTNGINWGITRNWTNGKGYARAQSFGSGMVIAEQPSLIQIDELDTLAVVTSGHSAYFFDQSGGSYHSRYFFQESLEYDSLNDEFVFVDTSGAQFRFFDFSPSLANHQQGQLKSYKDPAGNLINYLYDADTHRLTEMQRGSTTGSTTVTESFVYNYISTGDNAGLVASVTLRRKENTGDWTTVRKAEYTYYDDSESHGNKFDLKTATIKDAAGNVLDTTYYRYYQEGEAKGYAGGLKYVFYSASHARLVAEVAADPTTASDSAIAPYADHYFEYDSQQRATKEIAQGAGCSSCNGGQGSFQFTYSDSTNPDGYNSWTVKTIESLPDGNENIVYTNYLGEVMLQVLHDTTTGQKWSSYYRYDDSGRVIFRADPSAVTGYDDQYADLVHEVTGNYEYIRDTAGLVSTVTYYATTTATSTSAGGVKGYLSNTAIRQGELGTSVPQSHQTYYSHTAAGDTIYLPAASTVYANTDGTGALTTTYAYTFFTGKVQVESVTTTDPASGSSAVFYDAQDRPIWTKDAAGFLSYIAYDQKTGAVTKTIQDVNTTDPTKASTYANKSASWATPAGGGLHVTTTYEVDALGRPTKTTDANNNITYTVYNDANHEIRIYQGWNTTTNTPTGPTIVLREDREHGNGYLESLTMSALPVVVDGRPIGTEPISNLQSLSRTYYNAAGQEIFTDDYFALAGLTYTKDSTPTSPLGATNTNFYRTEFSYDKRGRLSRTERADGTIYRTVFDGLGRPVSEWLGGVDADNVALGTFWSPTNPGAMIKQKEYQYDNGGLGDSLMTSVTELVDDSTATVEWRTTTFAYDFRGRPITMALPDPDGPGTANPLVSPVYATRYDNLDRVIRESDASGDLDTVGHYTAYAYDTSNRTVTTTGRDPDGPGANNPLLPPVTITTLDTRGFVASQTDPMGRVTTLAYDGAGRQTKVTQPDPNPSDSTPAPFTLYGYDGVGNLTSVTDPLTHETTYTYDKAHRPFQVLLADADGVGSDRPTTTYAYDLGGRRESLTDPEGNKTIWRYDALGRVIEEENQLEDARTFKYDAANHLIKKTDRLGRITGYDYNLLDQLMEEGWYSTEAQYTAGTPIHTIVYDYDDAGQMKSATETGIAAYDYLYDNLGRVTDEFQDLTGLYAGWDVTFESEYNADGSRTKLQANFGPTMDYKDFTNNYDYDNLERLTKLEQVGGGAYLTGYKRFDFAYNAADQFEKITTYNWAQQPTLYSHYKYDGMGRIQQLTHTTSSTAPTSGFGSGALSGHAYTYDAASRVDSRTSLWRTAANPQFVGTVSYAYDHTDQLEGETRDWTTDDAYNYDDNGNRTAGPTGSFTIGDNNQLASGGGWTFTYDAEGNLTGKADADDRYTYTYDWRNRLTNVEYEKLVNSAWTHQWQVDNYYDAFDRLVRRKDDVQQTTWPSFANSDIIFTYQDGQVVLAFEVNGATTQRFVWGPQTDQLLATEYTPGYYGGGHIYFPLADAQGTIHDAAKFFYDSASQTYVTQVVMHRSIDAYGREMAAIATFGDQFGAGASQQDYAGPIFVYTGRYLDPLTGLQNNHHRWYAPELGRWMSEDPIGFAGGDTNLQRYVNNAPVMYTDPSGTIRKPDGTNTRGGGGVITNAPVFPDPLDIFPDDIGLYDPDNACRLQTIRSRAFTGISATHWSEAMDYLTQYVNKYGKIDRLWILDHGYKGGDQEFGDKRLSPEQLGQLKSLLAPNAEISFWGCNIADRRGYCQAAADATGSTVCANDNLVIHGWAPYWWNTFPYTVLGDWHYFYPTTPRPTEPVFPHYEGFPFP
jgi:RHS repeat-associated protein